MSGLTRVALLSTLLLVVLPALAGAAPRAPAPSGRAGRGRRHLRRPAPGARRANGRSEDSHGPLLYAEALLDTARAHGPPPRRDPGHEIQRRYSVVVDGFAVALPQSELGRLARPTGSPASTRASPTGRCARRAPASSARLRSGAPSWPLRAAASRSGSSTTASIRTHPYFRPKGYRMPRGFPKGRDRSPPPR